MHKTSPIFGFVFLLHALCSAAGQSAADSPKPEQFAGIWSGRWEGAGSSGGFELTLERPKEGPMTGTVSVTGEPAYRAVLKTLAFDGSKMIAKYDFTPDEAAEVLLTAIFEGNTAKGSWSLTAKADGTEAARGTWTVTRKPADVKVRLDTNKGAIVIAVHHDWAPHGADRFLELVTSGYYDAARFFRIRAGTWVQFGIAADPKVAQAWRSRTIPDDPWKGVTNKRGTVAFAFKNPNGRTTQVFINLKDNGGTHDLSLATPGNAPFVVFGEVIEGMDVADALYSKYGETAGGGIRAGRQDVVFERGNAYLAEKFPRLDYIRSARVVRP